MPLRPPPLPVLLLSPPFFFPRGLLGQNVVRVDTILNFWVRVGWVCGRDCELSGKRGNGEGRRAHPAPIPVSSRAGETWGKKSTVSSFSSFLSRHRTHLEDTRRDQSDSAAPGSRPYTRRVGRDTPGTPSRGTAARPCTDVDLPHGAARMRAARLYGSGGEPPRASAAHSHCSRRAAATSNTDTI